MGAGLPEERALCFLTEFLELGWWRLPPLLDFDEVDLALTAVFLRVDFLGRVEREERSRFPIFRASPVAAARVPFLFVDL